MCDKDTNVPNKTEYISREAAIEAAKAHYPKVNEMIAGIICLPVADVRPVMRGRWIESTELSDQVKGKKFCSNCGKAQYCIEITDKTIQIKSGTSKFCPECGAKMDGEKE